MLKNSVFALVVLVLVAAFFGVWYATASVPYFPASLQTTLVDCSDERPYGLDVLPVLDDFEADWYANDLRSMREQPLFPADTGRAKTVRFTWLRSFHALVTVRTIESADGKTRLVAKRMLGTDGCPETGPACEVDRILSPEERTRIATVQALGLAAPAHDCRSGVDGARWIIEVSGQGDYRFAQSVSPDAGPVRDLGLTMLELTGWRFDEIY